MPSVDLFYLSRAASETLVGDASHLIFNYIQNDAILWHPLVIKRDLCSQLFADEEFMRDWETFMGPFRP